MPHKPATAPRATNVPDITTLDAVTPPQMLAGGDRKTGTAILIVDLQNEVLHPKGKLREDLAPVAEDILAATRQLVAWARSAGHHIIWVRAAYRAGYVDAVRTSREALSETPGLLIDGTWGANVIDGVGRWDEDVVITKKRMSAFDQTDLDFILQSFGVERLIVAGTSTNFSVESTVRDAHSRDYHVIVVRDATGSRTGHLHEPSLAVMAHTFATITTVPTLMRSGSGVATHPSGEDGR